MILFERIEKNFVKAAMQVLFAEWAPEVAISNSELEKHATFYFDLMAKSQAPLRFGSPLLAFILLNIFFLSSGKFFSLATIDLRTVYWRKWRNSKNWIVGNFIRFFETVSALTFYSSRESNGN